MNPRRGGKSARLTRPKLSRNADPPSPSSGCKAKPQRGCLRAENRSHTPEAEICSNSKSTSASPRRGAFGPNSGTTVTYQPDCIPDTPTKVAVSTSYSPPPSPALPSRVMWPRHSEMNSSRFDPAKRTVRISECATSPIVVVTSQEISTSRLPPPVALTPSFSFVRLQLL